MFEDIHEIAENSAYLKAVEDRDVSLEMYETLPPYDECKHIEANLQAQGKLNFDSIFNEATGYYMIKCFLIADYCVDKAIFIKDVAAYKSMRFESARRKVALLLYQRFVSTDESITSEFPPQSSVFDLIRQRGDNDKKQNQSQLNLNALGGNINNGNNINGGDKSQFDSGMKTDRIVSSNNAPSQSHTAITQHGVNPSILTSNGNAHQNGNPSSSPNNMPQTLLQMGNQNNPIGVYGKAVRVVRDKVTSGQAPKDLFDDVAREVLMDLKLDAFPRFKNSEFFKRYIRTKWIETKPVQVKDFTTFRVLGRGGFGAVHACRKKNSGAIYAMKAINKKLVKVKSALDNVLEERNVLVMMKSEFVTNLKYALQDEETLYLVMDLMLGGDLKFHLINAGRFTEKRARFYAAQVLLGLEHVHRMGIIYRDMKLENVLLDHLGNCKISDLGLAVVTKVKIKGYAGTPGYTAPEMIKNKLYGPAADIFSYGVMLYRMLCGSKPFKGKIDRDLDKAVIEKKPQFPKEIFSKEATSILTALLQKRPEHRLGCTEKGIEEIKEHAFFESIDWGLLEAGYIDPPFVPNKFDVNAASLKDIGDFDRGKYKHVKLDERFKQRIKNFEYVSAGALQEEMSAVLRKVDENVKFEKFAIQPQIIKETSVSKSNACCTIL